MEKFYLDLKIKTLQAASINLGYTEERTGNVYYFASNVVAEN